MSIAGDGRRFVCQGVHMTFTGERGEPWEQSAARRTTLVFIGKAGSLPRAAIERSFKRCIAEK